MAISTQDKQPLTAIVNELSRLPGIGEKSAHRLAFYLLSLPEDQVLAFAKTIVNTRRAIRYCTVCGNIGFSEKCHICTDERRDESMLCVVGDPQDIIALERVSDFQGRYHVLGGLISPLDGVLPETLRIQELMHRLKQTPISEVILAINATVEGDATMLYLKSVLAAFDIKVSKLAYGLPMGGNIEYADEMTLQRALQGRVAID